jgi:DNA-binding transcriptional LysR family regulator
VRVLEGESDEIAQALRSGWIDFALAYDLGFDDGDIVRGQVATAPAHVIVAGSHRLAARKSVGLAELAGDPLILLDLPHSRDYFWSVVTAAGLSPGGLLMPNQSLLYSGRVLATRGLPGAMHIARELCGGQICITPDAASFDAPEPGHWLEKYYTINDNWDAEDRRKLLAFARDLLNSDYAGHRLTFQLFAQSPPFANMAAVYRSFDFDGPLDLARRAADLSDQVTA